MMRKGMVRAAALVAVIGVLCIAAGSLPAQVKPPADFTFSQGAQSPGTVTFSHAKHMSEKLKCMDCHAKIFKMKKGSADTRGGIIHGAAYCGTCHNGKVAFVATDKANCEKCHKK